MSESISCKDFKIDNIRSTSTKEAKNVVINGYVNSDSTLKCVEYINSETNSNDLVDFVYFYTPESSYDGIFITNYISEKGLLQVKDLYDNMDGISNAVQKDTTKAMSCTDFGFADIYETFNDDTFGIVTKLFYENGKLCSEADHSNNYDASGSSNLVSYIKY